MEYLTLPKRESTLYPLCNPSPLENPFPSDSSTSATVKDMHVTRYVGARYGQIALRAVNMHDKINATTLW